MIAIASDHGGYDLKERVKKYLEEKNIPYQDMGCDSKASCDYPVFGHAAARAVADGGEQQIGAQIEHNEIDLVIFLRDPLAPKAHEPDVSNVMRLCDMHNIPLATNLASAELLIKSLDRGDLEWREMYK